MSMRISFFQLWKYIALISVIFNYEYAPKIVRGSDDPYLLG
jgi:hypothetical protein